MFSQKGLLPEIGIIINNRKYKFFIQSATQYVLQLSVFL